MERTEAPLTNGAAKTNGVIKTNGAVTVYQPQKPVGPPKEKTPEQKIKLWERQAKAARKIISDKNYSVTIRGREHVMFKGWCALGGLGNREIDFTPEPQATGQIGAQSYVGFATLVERMPDGRRERIGTASAECSTAEQDWFKRPIYRWANGKRVKAGEELVEDFQRRSMAQTRAAVKILSANLRHIAEMAGYEGTPAEEMAREQPSPTEVSGAEQMRRESERRTRPESEPASVSRKDAPVSEQQIAALRKEVVGVTKAELARMLGCREPGIAAAIATLGRTGYQALMKDLRSYKKKGNNKHESNPTRSCQKPARRQANSGRDPTNDSRRDRQGGPSGGRG